ncbi:MAG: GGDEF domain-containing protein [Gammaproteobacteria bacterium]
MSTSVQGMNPKYDDYISEASSERIRKFYTPVDELQNLQQETLLVANVLQTSLDINKLIEIFAQKLAAFVEHDSLLYVNCNEGKELLIGKQADHTCSYQITLLEKSLGEITLSRAKAFDENEARWFEGLLCALVHPLNNAILYHQAIQTGYKDPVTGVNNRASMNATLEREVELAHRNGAALSVIMIDIDHFKNINDKYGHLAGDAVLKGVGTCLQECVRRSDLVFRYGGEEFVAILNTTDLAGATLLANRIRLAIKNRNFEHDGLNVKITVSAGVSILEHDFEANDLLNTADQALYQAKDEGRNRVIVYSPEDLARTVGNM